MEQDNLSALALDNLPVSVFIFNRRHEIIKYNQHFAREYHHVFNGEIWQGISLDKIFNEKLQQKFSHSWSRVLKGERFSQLVSFSSKSIQYHWEFTYQPLNNSNDVFNNGSAILKDISSEVKYQQQFISAHQDLLILKKTLDATTMFAEMDSRGIIAGVNALFTALTGFRENQLKGEHIINFIVDAGADFSWEDVKKSISEKKQWRGQIIINTKSDTGIALDAIINLISGDLQHPAKYVLAGSPISQPASYGKVPRKFSFTTLTDYKHENLWEWHLKTDKVHCSEKWKQTFDYPKLINHFSLEQWRLLVHPEDRGKVVKAIQDHINGKTFFYNETFRLLCGNGEYRWVAEKGKLTDEGFFIGKHNDIHEQKLHELTIKKNKKLYDEFIYYLPIGFYEADAQGRFVKMNPALVDIYGIEDSEGLVKQLNIFQNRFVVASGASKHIIKARNEKVAVRAEIKVDIKGSRYLRQRRDSVLYIELTIIPVTDEEKRLQGFITLHNDITERKRKEIQLENSERLLREAGTMARIGGWEYNVKKATYKWSDQVYKIFELPLHAAIPANIADAFFPEEAARSLNVSFRRTVNEGIPLDMKLPLITTAGNQLWVHLKAQAVKEDGKIAKVIGLLQDITDDKKREMEILNNRDFLKEAGQTAKIGAWEKDLVSDTIFWSPELYKIFEIEESANIKDIDFYAYFEQGDLLKAAIADCRQYGKSFDLKLKMTTGKAKGIWIRAIGRASVVSGKVSRIHGVFQDITELYELTAQLHRRDELLHLFFENINMVYIALDEAWNFTFINKEAAEITGEGPVIGQNIWTTAPFTNRKDLESIVKAAIAAQQTATEELNIPDKEKWYEFSFAPMSAGGISIFGRDITESKKLQSELSASNEQLLALNDYLASQNKQMQDFTNISSHNLRSPVANLKGILSMIGMAESEDEKQQYVNMLSDVINRIDDTLHDLLEIARLRNTLQIEKEQLSFEEVLDNTKKNLIIDIENTGTEINSNFEKTPVINYPRVYLESIFLNLISNAIKYRKTDKAPVVNIESDVVDDKIVLRISDNGSGMDMEKVKSKIFGFGKTFHQNKDAKGFGLYIIKNQVEAMGGGIHVDSIRGEGTTFTINF